MHVAISSDNAGALDWLVVDLRASCVEGYQGGRNALHEAVAARCPAVIDWVLSSSRCRDALSLWCGQDADGVTPLLHAVREQYAEGVEIMCDSETINSFWAWGLDSQYGGVLGQAHREAMQASSAPAAGRNVHKRLKRMLRAIERRLRVLALYDVHQAVWDSSLPSASGQYLPWECRLARVRDKMETQPWWGRFQAQRRAGTQEPPCGIHECAESFAMQAAVKAAQPAVVEWLLDAWGAGFGSAERQDPMYSLADYACCGGEEEVQKVSGDVEWDAHLDLWRTLLSKWYRYRGDGRLQVDDMVSIINSRLKTWKSHRVSNDPVREYLVRQLRLLNDEDTKGGALRHAKVIATVQLFIERFNERAVPRLDLLVQASLPRPATCLRPPTPCSPLSSPRPLLPPSSPPPLVTTDTDCADPSPGGPVWELARVRMAP